MKVVIVGAWNRSELEDDGLVNELLDELGRVYPDLFIVTTGCDRGIGKLVKNRCMPKQRGVKGEFDFVEIAVRIYADSPSKASLAHIWQARNAYLDEAGEEFHLFMDKQENSGGQMQDLLRRITQRGAPYSIYVPGVDTKPKLASLSGHK